MADVYEQNRKHLAEYETAFQARADQSGAVFAINGRIVGLECFDAKETFERLLSKLATSYALDAQPTRPSQLINFAVGLDHSGSK